jgi:membrane fusion protein
LRFRILEMQRDAMSNTAVKIKLPDHEDNLPLNDSEPLFRPEVLAGNQTQWLGTVLLKPKVSSLMFVMAAAIAGATVLSLLYFGFFTRKANISGWLVPEQGLARIFAPQTGVVTQLYVNEGMKVSKGTPLVVLSSEVRSEAVGATRKEIVQRIASRRDSMLQAKRTQDRLFEEQWAELHRRLNSLYMERSSLTRQLEFERTRLELSDRARDRSFRGRDLSTLKGSNPTEAAYLEQASRVQALERSRASFDRELSQLESTIRELPLRRQNQIAESDRSVAGLEQELVEAEARRQIVITAPHDGTVTGIQTELGGNANPSVPIMSLVPTGSALQAQLFGPSRAIGFVHPGQRVLLRYEAFPFQKFGLYEGVIRTVSHSAVSSSEMTQQLAGLASLYGANEPIYRVTVDLAQQTATAYGEAVPLQPGMRVDADVMIESRRLIEWVLDPLYSLTGKLR